MYIFDLVYFILYFCLYKNFSIQEKKIIILPICKTCNLEFVLFFLLVVVFGYDDKLFFLMSYMFKRVLSFLLENKRHQKPEKGHVSPLHTPY